VIDGVAQEKSLFQMIKNTHQLQPKGTIVAYSDNSSIMEGATVTRFYPRGAGHEYAPSTELTHTLMKVETHNHPTAISPFPGAAAGAGGEIRDEGATGRGAKPKAGLTGFTVSNLMIPGFERAWENAASVTAPFAQRAPAAAYGKPERIASPLQIMIDGPLGGAAFSNEFGRPVLGGFFRTYEQNVGRLSAGAPDTVYGYHKPIMIAGGIGSIADQHTHKNDIPVGSLLIQLGGPGMRIGMGGSAASSMATGANTADLDFDSVQRGNPEMERRAQEGSTRAGRWRGQPDHLDPRRRRRGCRTPSRRSPTTPGAARFSTCARCRWKKAACRRRKSGATSRRSATCWPSRRRTCRCSPPCASASAACSPRSAWRPRNAS
jgi:phosphoribosylformylglycinamidine synthase